LHGSVSRYLVGRVTCPLLVLPREAIAEDAHQVEREAHPIISMRG
jgi:hypothetical protein